MLVDLEGQQAIDFLCYNAHDPEERYHAPNTIKLQHNIYLGKGSVLWSVRARKMMTIVEDTCGGHDTIFGCCSFELDDVRYGRRNPRCCQKNFELELARHGLGPSAVVPNINFFMRVPVTDDGECGHRGGMVEARRSHHPACGDGYPRGDLQLPRGIEPGDGRGPDARARHPVSATRRGVTRGSRIAAHALTRQASRDHRGHTCVPVAE